MRRDLPLALRQLLEPDQSLVQPRAVRVLGGELGLDLVVLDDPPGGGVHQEDLAGLQPPFRTTLLAGMSRTPASLASTTRPSSVTQYRPGRSPLRSRTAPTTVPSVKLTLAGPSHASISVEWNS